MPKKDPFKQPGTIKFQLVHRSQRDPLIHDSEASQNIFKPIGGKKGKSLNDPEAAQYLNDSGPSDRSRAPVGEASKYGVYYDDTKYDYMQHLRPVGELEDNVDSFLIELPGKKKGKAPVMTLKEDFADIPDEYLPPKVELPKDKDYETQRNIPTDIAGFQPDMNPHLRQTLEALDDDEFVDDGLADDFFAGLVADGQASGEYELDFPFEEEGVEEADAEEEPEVDDPDAPWEERFKKFKKGQQRVDRDALPSEMDFFGSEGGDTVGSLPAMSVLGIRKRRRKAGSEASGYTMSSSSMFRNEGLTMLDERFDTVYEQYENDHDVDCVCPECDERPRRRKPDGEMEEDDDDASSNVSDILNSRDDFEAIMDEFLDKFEIVGKQLKPTLEGATGLEKLETLRKAMTGLSVDEMDQAKDIIKRLVKMQDEGDVIHEIDPVYLSDYEEEEPKDRWDCETILTTYSNLENHPRVIKARDSRKVAKIRLDSKTGLPVVEEEGETTAAPTKTKSAPQRRVPVDRSALKHDTFTPAEVQEALTRQKDESKEAKALRKQAVKLMKQTRRAEKKDFKESFATEKQAHLKAQQGRQKGGVGLKKL